MLGRYVHICGQARREAIATLGRTATIAGILAMRGEGTQSRQAADGQPSTRCTNYLKTKDLLLVGVAGFEPATTRTPSVCATRLRHTPTVIDCARVTTDAPEV